MMTVVLGLLLGIAGSVVVAVTSLLMLGPLRRPLLAALERARVGRCVARRDRGDARLAAHDVEGAIREFAAAFCFIVPRADPRLLAEIARLHAGLLSRLVLIGDDFPGERIEFFAMAKVERLLDQWVESQRRLVRGQTSSPDAAGLRHQRRATEHAIRELASELAGRRRRPLVH